MRLSRKAKRAARIALSWASKWSRLLLLSTAALVPSFSWSQETAAPAAQAGAPGAPGAPGVAADSKQLEALSDELFLQGLMDPFDYDPRGRKDPFAQPVLDRPVPPGASHGPLLPLQHFELGALKLVGIIWDVKRPRAMITTPNNKIHIVGPNTKIGTRNGYIAVIREGEIVVVETIDQDGRLVSSAQIMKLAK